MNLWLENAIAWIGLSVILSGALIALINLIQLTTSTWVLSKRVPAGTATDNWFHFAEYAPSISIVVPAYNEGPTIGASITALLACEYPDLEIIIVNDGSSDETLATLLTRFELIPTASPETGELKHEPYRAAFITERHPNLLVIDKVNGGKADALNAGINLAKGDYICVIDADSILDRHALLLAARHFIDGAGDVVTVGGAIRLSNGCDIENGQIKLIQLPKNPIALLQTVEYMRTFHLARMAMGHAGALTLVSGAFGIFSKKLLFEVGGYRCNTVGEDFELVLRLHRHLRTTGRKNSRIVYSPDAVCWTQAPESLSVLGRQRARWQRGALESLWHHRAMIGNPRYGRIGLLSMVESVVSDLITPITELLGYILIPIAAVFGLLSYSYFIAFIGLSLGFGIVQSAGAILVEEIRFRRFPKLSDTLLLLLIAIVENFGYRQLCGLWRMRGFLEYLQGKKTWGQMPRKALN